MKTFKQFLIEGGNAVKGVVSIPKANVMPTIHEIGDRLLNKLGVTWHPVGSTGKKDFSNDLDIAVSILPNVNMAKFLANQIKTDLPEVKEIKVSNIVSFDYPIVGMSGERVQVDLMPQKDIAFAKYVLTKDKFTSILINKISTVVLPFISKDEPEVLKITRFTYDVTTGLALAVKVYKKHPDGKLYASGKYVSKIPLTDPDKILLILFGHKATHHDIENVHNIMKFIQSGNAEHAQIDITKYPELPNLPFLPYTQEQISVIKTYVDTELYN